MIRQRLIVGVSVAAAVASGAVGTYRFASAATVDKYTFTPAPIASAGSLAPNASVPVTVTATASRVPQPGIAVWLSFTEVGLAPPGSTGGSALVGTVKLTSTPTSYTTNGSGQILLTYKGAAVPPSGGRDVITAQNAATAPTLTKSDPYAFSGVASYTWSVGPPIAASGSLAAGSTTNFSAIAKDSTGTAIPGAIVFLSLTSTASTPGTATATDARTGLKHPLASAPKRFFADTTGAVPISYTVPSSLPSSGTDTVTAQDRGAAPRITSTTTYSFSGSTSCTSTSVPLVGAYQGGATAPVGLAGVNANSTCVMVGGVSGLQPPATWLTGSISGTRATLSGDVTGDGKTDLVGVNDSSAFVAISTGSGFSTPTQWSTAAFFGTVATLLADVNGDGKADLVAVNSSSVSVMLSNGVNGFGPPTVWSTANFFGSRANLAADVNGDHSADLVAISDSSTWVMLSNGVSGFGTPILWSTSPFFGSRATLAADVNGDGKVDLVAVSDNSVWVMRSTGTTFTAPASWSSTVFYGSLATLAGDLNGDGRVDLIAVNSNSVYAMLSNGSTAFGAPQVWARSSV
jgi:hypothetical protein